MILGDASFFFFCFSPRPCTPDVECDQLLSSPPSARRDDPLMNIRGFPGGQLVLSVSTCRIFSSLFDAFFSELSVSPRKPNDPPENMSALLHSYGLFHESRMEYIRSSFPSNLFFSFPLPPGEFPAPPLLSEFRLRGFLPLPFVPGTPPLFSHNCTISALSFPLPPGFLPRSRKE